MVEQCASTDHLCCTTSSSYEQKHSVSRESTRADRIECTIRAFIPAVKVLIRIDQLKERCSALQLRSSLTSGHPRLTREAGSQIEPHLERAAITKPSIMSESKGQLALGLASAAATAAALAAFWQVRSCARPLAISVSFSASRAAILEAAARVRPVNEQFS